MVQQKHQWTSDIEYEPVVFLDIMMLKLFDFEHMVFQDISSQI